MITIYEQFTVHFSKYLGHLFAVTLVLEVVSVISDAIYCVY